MLKIYIDRCYYIMKVQDYLVILKQIYLRMVIQNNRDMNLKLLRILIIISVFHLSISNLIAQEEQLNIQANHKVFTPAGKGPFSTIIAIPGCSGVSLNGAETDEERLADEGDRLFRRHYTKMVERLKKEEVLEVQVD